jgi:hypothetical protein
MASAQHHVELALELRPGADRAAVERWLLGHGLDVLPLVSGVLASGESGAARTAFGAEPEGELPVPGELRAHVKSVVAVPPMQLHGGT